MLDVTSNMKVSKRKIIIHETDNFCEEIGRFKISFTKESLILAQDER